MSLRELIDAGLSAAPECVAVSYIDMSAGLVLATASRTPYRQEILDRFAKVAGQIFRGPNFASLRATAGDDGIRQATVLGIDHLYVFQRIDADSDHALCLAGRRGADASRLRQHARDLGADVANVL